MQKETEVSRQQALDEIAHKRVQMERDRDVAELEIKIRTATEELAWKQQEAAFLDSSEGNRADMSARHRRNGSIAGELAMIQGSKTHSNAPDTKNAMNTSAPPKASDVAGKEARASGTLRLYVAHAIPNSVLAERNLLDALMELLTAAPGWGWR